MEYDDYERESGSGFWPFVLGLSIGVVGALLVAPRSGEETRERVAGKAREGKLYVQDAVEQVRYQVGTAVNDAKDQVSGVTEKVTDAVYDAKSRVSEAVKAATEAYRDELKTQRVERAAHAAPGSTF